MPQSLAAICRSASVFDGATCSLGTTSQVVASVKATKPWRVGPASPRYGFRCAETLPPSLVTGDPATQATDTSARVRTTSAGAAPRRRAGGDPVGFGRRLPTTRGDVRITDTS